MAARKNGATPRPPKTPEKTPAGALVPQGHGGAIKTGGNPGNRGGTGRPPHAIRDDWRGLLDAHGTGFLKQILQGAVTLRQKCESCGHEPKRKVKVATSVDQGLTAIATLARFGIGTKDELTTISPEVRMRVHQTVALIASRAKWDSEELLKALDELW